MNDYDHNYNPYMNAGTINNQNKNFSIGHQYYSSGPREDDYYRSMYKFDLTPIPANAIITNVMLVSWVTDYVETQNTQVYYAALVNLLPTSIDPANMTQQNIYNNATSGKQQVDCKYTDTLKTNVTDSVKARISFGSVVYGAHSNVEATNTSKANLQLQLVVQYYLPFNVTAKNNFTGGTMGIVAPGISNSSATVPFTKTNTKLGDAFTLTAIPQTDNTGYSRVWNNYAPLYQSVWSRTRANGSVDNRGYNISLGFYADSTDKSAAYTANLRCNYSITRNDQSIEFNNTINSIATQVVEGNILTAPLTQTVGSNTYCFLNWSDGVSQNTRTINSSTSPLTANYKGIHLSNTSSTFTNNSQRKIVRTKDGWYHQVYESSINGVSHVWLEESTNGTTWFLGNNGQPLDNGGGKCPSIDWHYNPWDQNNTSEYAIVVVFQQPFNSTYAIEYAVFVNTNGSYACNISAPLYTEPTGGDSYSVNANPNIAWGNDYKFTLCFERKSTAGGMQPGIYLKCGYIAEGGVESYPAPNAPLLIIGTSSSSTNATIAMNKQSITNSSYFDVVYQTVAGVGSTIMDVEVSCSSNGSSFVPSLHDWSTVSSMSGYLNYKPSMVQMPDSSIRVCWIRDLYGGGSYTPNYVNAVYWSSKAPSVYTYSGNMVNSVSLNIKDSSSSTYYTYAQNTNNTTWQNYVSNGSSVNALSTTGQYVQLSNGSATSSMSVASFYPSSLPYYFSNVMASSGGLSKVIRHDCLSAKRVW